MHDCHQRLKTVNWYQVTTHKLDNRFVLCFHLQVLLRVPQARHSIYKKLYSQSSLKQKNKNFKTILHTQWMVKTWLDIDTNQSLHTGR